jgi:aryl-alcohol dehydrogenase-like predicted oxidoreductase
MNGRPIAAAAGKIDVGGDLRRAVALDVNFIDTADSYGPEVSERLIANVVDRGVTERQVALAVLSR